MNYEALNALMDGEGDLALARQIAILDWATDLIKARRDGLAAQYEERAAHLVRLLRFLNEVLADIYERSDPTSKTPLNDLGMIRTKARVATEQAAKSGLLS